MYFLQEFQKKAEETGKSLLKVIKEGSQTLNDNIQKAQA